MLYCEVRCANLQQICTVWELLKPRAVAVQDGFAALSGSREASVQLRGAVVHLCLAPLQRLQQGLGTVSRWVEALGLLQVAGHPAAVTADRRWPVALAVAALRLVALLVRPTWRPSTSCAMDLSVLSQHSWTSSWCSTAQRSP